MRIEKNTDMLCLRFVDVGKLDCIGEHIDVIKKNNYVWFGKIGVKPAKNKVEAMLEDGKGFILLKKPKGVYLCEFDAFSYDRPEYHEYPAYYNNKILLGEREFSIWFRITEIIEVKDNEILDEIIIKSSREKFMITVNKSMTSIFYVVNRKEVELNSPSN